MNNIVILLIIFNAISVSLTKNMFHNLNFNLNRLTLKYIIFKEKKLAKIIKNVANNFDIYHNKSIVCLAEGINSYNELSEDEKTLIEVIISLCY